MSGLIFIGLGLLVALSVVAALVVPGLLVLRRQLRIDLERRLAEFQIRRTTSDALIRLLREARAGGLPVSSLDVIEVEEDDAWNS